MVATQFAAQAKPIMMALNISKYISLYGYGYRNVYELNELVNVNDPRIAFEGSLVEQKPPPVAPRVTKRLISDMKSGTDAQEGRYLTRGSQPGR